MRRAIITVGLGFGDEGKGAAVDFLARHLDADLVVRYCGGSQAGHNVELPDGRRHTFAQFGAATLAPSAPRTYLGPNVVIDPLALVREASHLAELGVSQPAARLVVHPRCLVATYWHRVLNQVRELARGAGRHGSCGQGIGEARHYWLKHGNDAVFAADLRNLDVLRDKLELLRQRALLLLQELIPQVPSEQLRELALWDSNTEGVACDLYETFPADATLSATVPACRAAVFEGAQGVLLDEYRGFHPHTTWSTVTPHHAWELVSQMDVDAVCVLGITRAYTTRHGEGPLPTFSPELTARLQDPGNPVNRWQGGLRCGWLDLPLLRYAAQAAGPLDGLVLNHLDQLAGAECLVCDSYRQGDVAVAEAPDLAGQTRLGEQLRHAEPVLSPATPDGIAERLARIAPVVVRATGPTHLDRAVHELPFRRRRLPASAPPAAPS
jgi:adenylosuccinate synthase